MFDSLDEQMRHDEQEATSKKERMMKWALVAVTSIILFGGLYFGIRLLE